MPTTKNRTVVSGEEFQAQNSSIDNDISSYRRAHSTGMLHRASLGETLCLSQLPTGSDAADARTSGKSVEARTSSLRCSLTPLPHLRGRSSCLLPASSEYLKSTGTPLKWQRCRSAAVFLPSASHSFLSPGSSCAREAVLRSWARRECPLAVRDCFEQSEWHQGCPTVRLLLRSLLHAPKDLIRVPRALLRMERAQAFALKYRLGCLL